MKMHIENIPLTQIAYIRHTGPYGADNNKTMEQLKAWAKDAHLLNEDSIILGIAQDNPQQTAQDSCRYDVCLVVDNGFSAEDSRISFGILTAGRYAVFTVKHTAEAIQKAWGDIFPELQRQGLIVDITRPILERYAVKMVRQHQCEICVPLSEAL